MASSSVASDSATGTATSSAADASETVPYASDDPNYPLWNETQGIRGSLGATVMGPQDEAIVLQNPDLLAPPTTDAGSVYVPMCRALKS